MPPRYSPKSVLRHTQNALLDRYFHERNLLADIDIHSLGESKVQPLFDAWQALPEPQRAAIDADLIEVNRLAHEGGELAMLDEGSFHELDLAPVFAELDGFHDRAMLVFLDHPKVFEVASFFNEADTRPSRYWMGRKDLPRVDAEDDEKACTRLGSELGGYLQKAEGRGYQCHVDPYIRAKKVYFFAYPEDYSATSMEYQEGSLQRRRVRPAFEIIFVYEKDAGTLDLYFQGSKKRVSDLQEIFGWTILRTELGNVVGSERVYDLTALKRRSFGFVYDPNSGIVDVRVKKLRLSAVGGQKQRVTLEADSSREREAVYDLLDRQFQSDREPASPSCSKLALSAMNVTQARIEVSFAPDGTRRRRTRTFDVAYPNACPLGHEGRDAIVRQMLIDSNIEPRPRE